jgi:lysosomal acid lipase/cholesteryl ester hydrolase
LKWIFEAFFLVNNGFDVWLSNRRGSAYSKGHVRYNRSDEEFWDFSFHECGFYDIKAEINLIANKTRKSQKIILLGYSMGSTETYIYAILRKKHARRHVAGIVSLSPIAFMRYSGGLVAKLAIASKAIQVNFHMYCI